MNHWLKSMDMFCRITDHLTFGPDSG